LTNFWFSNRQFATQQYAQAHCRDYGDCGGSLAILLCTSSVGSVVEDTTRPVGSKRKRSQRRDGIPKRWTVVPVRGSHEVGAEVEAESAQVDNAATEAKTEASHLFEQQLFWRTVIKLELWLW